MHVTEEMPTDALIASERLLVRALELVINPERWTQGTWARDRRGVPTAPQSSTATSWCAAGAIVRAEFELHGPSEVLACADADGLPQDFDRSPRLSRTLRLVAPPMARVCARALGLEFGNAAEQAAEFELRCRGELLDTTLVAAVVNDLNVTEHTDVTSAIALAVDVVHEEVGHRCGFTLDP
jgi:hypothetical protein